MTRVDGQFRTPTVLFLFDSRDPYDAIARYAGALRARGLVPARDAGQPDWWRRPIFCGWGEQAYLAHKAAGGRQRYWLSAPNFSAQTHYDRSIELLGEAGLNPGTVVIDDRWQAQYAVPDPDPAKWPDLRGWIARRHDAGQRVLLWWNAWSAEGLARDETIRSAHGEPVACDPSNPGYRARLRGTLAHLLGRDGLDADGLMVDLTASVPHGEGFRHHGPESGVALLRTLLATIHRAAKDAKSDALVITHSTNPSFAAATDMIRLNDMIRLEEAGSGPNVVAEIAHRARIARAALPELLIDTDNWPAPDRATWRDYVRVQAELGVPSLYYASHLDVTCEPLRAEDYALVRDAWTVAT